MSVPVNIEQYQKYLPMDENELHELHVSPLIIDRVKRLRSLYAFWLQFPNLNNSDIVNQDMSLFRVGKSEAYDDIHLVQIILGNLQAASKDFMRWKITNMLMEDRAGARRNNDWRAAVAADDKIAKYHKLDQPDTPDLAFDKIVPQMLEPSDDPTVIGLKRQKDLRDKIKKMKSKYLQQDAVDSDFEEVEQENNPL